MAGKPKAVGVGRVARAKKVALDQGQLKQYRLRYGTPNQLCEPIAVATEAKVRADIVKHLRTEIEPWCKRHNLAGLPVIEQLILDLQETTFHIGTLDTTREQFKGSKFNTGQRISGCYDEHYGVTIVYEVWKEWS